MSGHEGTERVSGCLRTQMFVVSNSEKSQLFKESRFFGFVLLFLQDCPIELSVTMGIFYIHTVPI